MLWKLIATIFCKCECSKIYMNVYACLFIYLYTYICMYPALNVYNKKYIIIKNILKQNHYQWKELLMCFHCVSFNLL